MECCINRKRICAKCARLSINVNFLGNMVRMRNEEGEKGNRVVSVNWSFHVEVELVCIVFKICNQLEDQLFTKLTKDLKMKKNV